VDEEKDGRGNRAPELGRTVDAVRAKASEEWIRLSLDIADDEANA
jgi:hypothetical protein